MTLASIDKSPKEPMRAVPRNLTVHKAPDFSCKFPMSSLKELVAARASLDAEIAKARKIESEAALKNVHALIAEFGFTAQQVFPWRPEPAKVAAKYRDEKSGATWTGRGKPPAWIAGKNREDFLIHKPTSAHAALAEAQAPAQGPFLAQMAAAAAANGRVR